MPTKTYATVVSSKKTDKSPLLLGIIGVLLIAILMSGLFFLYWNNTEENTPTATILISKTLTSSVGPSGREVESSVKNIITDPQTTNAINQNYGPTQIMNTFPVGKTIFVTFMIHSQNKAGFIEAKWYTHNHFFKSDTLKHSPKNDVGYASATYNNATKGSIELYWCIKQNCSDAKLAQVITFAVNK